jgi:hypothetical protein
MKQGMNNVTVMPVQISNQDEHCSRTDAECHQFFLQAGMAFRGSAIYRGNHTGPTWLKLSLLRKRKQMNGGWPLAKKIHPL